MALEKLISYAVNSKKGSTAFILFWLALGGLLFSFLPQASQQEVQNPPSLPSTARSVIGASYLAKVQPDANFLPGVLIFYDHDGIGASEKNKITKFAKNLSLHPLSDMATTPKVPSPSNTLSCNEKLCTVVLEFFPTDNQALLHNILGRLSAELVNTFGRNLITSPLTNGLIARLTGPAGIAVDTSSLFKNADTSLLIGTTFVILAILVLVYRSLILPLIPLASVALAYTIVSSLLGALAKLKLLTLDAQTISIMIVLMFGVGTDYALLLINRYKENTASHLNLSDALSSAVQSATRPILLSSISVASVLLLLLLSSYGPIHRFAIPFALGVLMTAVMAVTLVPALLRLLGNIVFVPKRFSAIEAPDKLTLKLSTYLRKRPTLFAATCSVCLILLGTGFAMSRSSNNILETLPTSAQSVQGYHLLAKVDSQGSIAPVNIVVVSRDKPANLVYRISSLKDVLGATGPFTANYHNTYIEDYSVILKADPFSNKAITALQDILIRLKSGVANSTKIYPVGVTAQNLDTSMILARDSLVLIPSILVLLFLLLTLIFGSPILSVYLVISVILSYFAAMGAGWFIVHFLLGINAFTDGISLYTFIFLVSLGEDYNIFLISRIYSEAKSSTFQDAVVKGLSSTSLVITAAGLILAGTFAVLTGIPLKILLEFGIIMAIGILIDTFIVRSILVPAIALSLNNKAFWPKR